LYDPLHPSVLRLLGIVLNEAAEVNTPVSMCGEMAGDHTMTRLLLSMGLRDFSMHPGNLLEVKHVITETDLGSLKAVSRRLLNATNPIRIQALLRELNDLSG
jgi:phosphotransferase system enzyme I (PtsI)